MVQCRATGRHRMYQYAKIRLRGVRKLFFVRGRPVEALAGMSLDIRGGEFFCIVGPSGCGKTTLLRLVAGLETMTDGTIEIARDATGLGTPTSGPSSRGTRDERPVNSMVFQEQSIFPWLTVRDNVAFGLKARGFPRRVRHQIAQSYIRTVGLTGFEQALPHQLSGGMKQRVSLARAFANDPEVLLMDEPFAALDEQTKLILQAELLRIWESSGKTVLYVTHSIDEAIVLGDRVMVMSARPGRIKEILDVSALFARPRHVEEVKGSPLYGELFRRIWEQLRDEVAAAKAEETGQVAKRSFDGAEEAAGSSTAGGQA